jgi:hypothetical protein
MALDALRRGLPLKGRKQEQPAAQQTEPALPVPAEEQASPAEPPLDLDALDNLGSLDVDGLKRLLAGLEAALRQVEERLPAAEVEAKTAFERGDLKGVEAAWQLREKLQAGRQDLLAHHARARGVVQERLQPDLDGWQAQCQATVERWRDEQTRLLERIDALQTELSERLEALSRLPRERQREQRELIERYDELVRWLSPLSPPMPPVDWSVPEADIRAIAGRLAGLGRTLVTWVVRR